jgi:hypothetical protein
MVGSSTQDYTQSPGMQAASGCLLADSAGNVLLVKPTYKPPWECQAALWSRRSRRWPHASVRSGRNLACTSG